MLCKDVCRRCHIKTDVDIWYVYNADKDWDAGFIYCVMDGNEINTRKAPPERCPYKFEHSVGSCVNIDTAGVGNDQ